MPFRSTSAVNASYLAQWARYGSRNPGAAFRVVVLDTPRDRGRVFRQCWLEESTSLCCRQSLHWNRSSTSSSRYSSTTETKAILVVYLSIVVGREHARCNRAARRRAEEQKSIYLRTSTFPRMPSPITIDLPRAAATAGPHGTSAVAGYDSEPEMISAASSPALGG